MTYIWAIIFTAFPIVSGLVAYYGFGKNPFVFMILAMLLEVLIFRISVKKAEEKDQFGR